MASRHEERRVIIVGKTGNGKSSTGNTILGNKMFKADVSLKAVTSECSVATSIPRNEGRVYKVCDTPGLFDADSNKAERSLEINRSVTEICPNPHVFLLVFSSANRLTEEECCTVDMLRVIFGEKVFDHCILVFTRGRKFGNDEHFKKILNESQIFQTIAENCKNRVVRVENESQNEESGLDNLLTTIEEVCNNGSKIYDYKEIHKHVKELSDAIKLFDKKTKGWRNHVEKKEKIEYKTKETEENVALINIMDNKLVRALASMWTVGYATTKTLLKYGVSSPVAHGMGAVAASGVGIVGIFSELSAPNKKTQAALKHHKQN